MKSKFLTIISALMIALLTLTACGGPKTVKDFLETKEAKEELGSLQDSLENELMSVAIEAEDDALIIAMSIKEDLGAAKDSFAPMMEQAMDAQSSLFVEMANEIKGYTKQSSVKIVIKCLDHEGDEIFSVEYSSNK